MATEAPRKPRIDTMAAPKVSPVRETRLLKSENPAHDTARLAEYRRMGLEVDSTTDPYEHIMRQSQEQYEAKEREIWRKGIAQTERKPKPGQESAFAQGLLNDEYGGSVHETLEISRSSSPSTAQLLDESDD